MAQQDMQFERKGKADQSEGSSYTAGYQQDYDEYAVPGQKIIQPQGVSSNRLTSVQRFVLAIVSLSLFAFAFMMAIIAAFIIPADTMHSFVPALAVFGMMFATLLIVVNVIASRKN